MKRLLPFSFLVIIAITLGACAGSSARAPQSRAAAAVEPYYDAAPAPTMMAYSSDGAVANEAAAGSGGGDASASQVQRLVIQNADLSVVVADVELRMDEIQNMAEEMGGFVVSSNLYQGYTNDYARSGSQPHHSRARRKAG